MRRETDSPSHWYWNDRRHLAVALIADGELWKYQIAERVGVCDRQLRRWRRQPEFQAAVARRVEEIRVELMAELMSKYGSGPRKMSEN